MMISLIKSLLSPVVVKDLLKAFSEVVLQFLIQRTVSEVAKFVGKFIPIGGPVFGRRYAFTLTTTKKPPAGHPKAWFICEVSKPEWGVSFYLWAVSFPEKKWDALPESYKVHIKF